MTPIYDIQKKAEAAHAILGKFGAPSEEVYIY